MKGRKALVSVVTAFALVGTAAPAHAASENPVGTLVGAGAAVMGIACNVVHLLGLPLCQQ